LSLPDWGRPLEAPTRRFPIVFEGTEQCRDRIRVDIPAGYAPDVPGEVTLPGRWLFLFMSAGADSAGLSLDRTLELREATVLNSDMEAARSEFRRVVDAYQPRWKLIGHR
jgi:hypothetical protein